MALMKCFRSHWSWLLPALGTRRESFPPTSQAHFTSTKRALTRRSSCPSEKRVNLRRSLCQEVVESHLTPARAVGTLMLTELLGCFTKQRLEKWRWRWETIVTPYLTQSSMT